MKRLSTFTLSLITTSLLLASCSSDSTDEEIIEEVVEDVIDDGSSDSGDDSANTDNILPVDTSLFADSGLVSVETVDCTLSNGTSTECYSITISGFPADRTELGEFCPGTITTGADEAGKWFDDGELYDLTGEFVANLDVFYGDSFWQLYDEDTGVVDITDTQESCELAAIPDTTSENVCVQCDIEYYVDSGEGVENTYIIPITPVLRSSGDTGSISSHTGLALNGVDLAAAAPAELILSAYTIAAFDDCVGHVNPFEGYHYHGANHGNDDCPAIDNEIDGHAGIIGYAMDGFAIYAMLDENGDEPEDLDDCRGQTDGIRGYHYHSAGPGENAFIGCFSGETVDGGNDRP